MKPLDLFLLSIAIGLTTFTLYVLSGGKSEAMALPEEASRAPKNDSFRSIVLHHSATHGGSATVFNRNHRTRLKGLAYHFVIGNGSGSDDGEIETGYRWRDQIPGPHTKNNAVNRESIAICLVGDFESRPPTQKQIAALLTLLERLGREYAIPAEQIRSHREVDPETLCPGRGLPTGEIRAALSRKLGQHP